MKLSRASGRPSRRIIRNSKSGRECVALPGGVRQCQVAVERWPGNPQHLAELVDAQALVFVDELPFGLDHAVGADQGWVTNQVKRDTKPLT